MFAKATIEEKMAEQGNALQNAAQLISEQVLTPYLGDVYMGLTAENVEKALHATVNNTNYGKHVLVTSD